MDDRKKKLKWLVNFVCLFEGWMLLLLLQITNFSSSNWRVDLSFSSAELHYKSIRRTKEFCFCSAFAGVIRFRYFFVLFLLSLSLSLLRYFRNIANLRHKWLLLLSNCCLLFGLDDINLWEQQRTLIGPMRESRRFPHYNSLLQSSSTLWTTTTTTTNQSACLKQRAENNWLLLLLLLLVRLFASNDDDDV